MHLYLDANVIIYMIQGRAGLRQAVLSWVDKAEAQPQGVLITSYLSTVECRTKPLREGQHDRLALFDGFFARKRLFVGDVTRTVLDRTTDLRASFGFKTADAIHLATAVIQEANCFLTSDRAFKRYKDLQVEVIDPDAF